MNAKLNELSVAAITGRYTYKTTPAMEDILEEIATSERRKRAEVARFLMERGLAQYRRDGLLLEPEDGWPSE